MPEVAEVPKADAVAFGRAVVESDVAVVSSRIQCGVAEAAEDPGSGLNYRCWIVQAIFAPC